MSALGQGLLEGQQFGQNFNAARTAVHERQLDEQARQASASAIPGAPPPAAAQPDTGLAHKLKDIVVGFYDKLHHHTLNDQHAPNGAAQAAPPAVPEVPDTAPDGTAIPPQDKANVVAANAAATDPSASAGIPQQSPAQSAATSKKAAHSMTAADDDEIEDKILAASRAAALAGEDPVKVYQNLTAIKTAHYQGNILKNLNAASVALQRGDNKSVEQALKNVYYYFPNGEDLTIEHDSQGRLLYQDPFSPTDQNGNANMIPVDAAHIQMLGQAATDGTKVQETINAAKTAGVERQAKLATAQAAVTNSGANVRRAGAAEREAAVKERLIPSQIYSNTAKGAYDEARARMDNLRLKLALKGRGTLDKNQQGAADAAAKAVFDLSQGLPSTVSVVDAAGNPSMSPAAGHTIRDEKKIPEYLKGLSPEQTIQVAATAGQIAAGNVGKMSTTEAAQLAAQVEKNRAQSHETVTGHKESNVRVSKDGNWISLWNGVSKDGQDLGSRTIQVSPVLGQALLAGRSSMPTEDEARAEGGDQSLDDGDADPGYDPNDPNDDPSYHIPAIPAEQ